MRVALTMALVLWGLASACSDGKDYPSIQVTSIAFGDEGMIPIRHTCEGEGLSPPLKISDVPDDTVGIALPGTEGRRAGGDAPGFTPRSKGEGQ